MSEHMKDLEQRLREKQRFEPWEIRLPVILLDDALSIVREYLEQQQKREWVSVEDRLPQTGELVWGILSGHKDGGNPSYVEYELASGTWFFISVTHWCEHIPDTPPPFGPLPTNNGGEG